MMGKKKLTEIKAEAAALLRKLPGRSPRAWIQGEIKSAYADSTRDAETLEMLCAALEREVPNGKKAKSRRKPAKQ
jgi:hypothetical protein